MISSETLLEALVQRGISIFAGVPDSLLSNFCAYLDDHGVPKQHIITANEGNAVALVAGYHMATGKIGAVYLQNSGIGNTVNPLTSITDPEVYRIPLLMIIGWRGEPGVKDEPQHVKQGRITLEQLRLLEIPHWVLDAHSDVNSVLEEAFAKLNDTNAPVALLVRKDTFAKYESKRHLPQMSSLKREEALEQILSLAEPSDLIVSTTGKTSREIFEIRLRRGEAQRDFLTVGGMGHTASIALGVALGCPNRRVICLDGDGSVLMHMGALPIIGDVQPANLVHVLLNNASHESVGGQPTVAGNLDFSLLSKACGYRGYALASNANELNSRWAQLSNQQGPFLLEVKIGIGSRDDLGRPTGSAEENKRAFMEFARA